MEPEPDLTAPELIEKRHGLKDGVLFTPLNIIICLSIPCKLCVYRELKECPFVTGEWSL